MFSEVRRHDKSGHAVKQDAATGTDSSDQPKKKKKKKKNKEHGQGDGEKKEEKNDEHKSSDKAKKNNPELYDALHKAFKVAVEVRIALTSSCH